MLPVGPIAPEVRLRQAGDLPFGVGPVHVPVEPGHVVLEVVLDPDHVPQLALLGIVEAAEIHLLHAHEIERAALSLDSLSLLDVGLRHLLRLHRGQGQDEVPRREIGLAALVHRVLRVVALDLRPDEALAAPRHRPEPVELSVHELHALVFEVAPPVLEPRVARGTDQRSVAVSGRPDHVEHELHHHRALRPGVDGLRVHRHQRLGPAVRHLHERLAVRALAAEKVHPRHLLVLVAPLVAGGQVLDGLQEEERHVPRRAAHPVLLRLEEQQQPLPDVFQRSRRRSRLDGHRGAAAHAERHERRRTQVIVSGLPGRGVLEAIRVHRDAPLLRQRDGRFGHGLEDRRPLHGVEEVRVERRKEAEAVLARQPPLADTQRQAHVEVGGHVAGKSLEQDHHEVHRSLAVLRLATAGTSGPQGQLQDDLKHVARSAAALDRRHLEVRALVPGEDGLHHRHAPVDQRLVEAPVFALLNFAVDATDRRIVLDPLEELGDGRLRSAWAVRAEGQHSAAEHLVASLRRVLEEDEGLRQPIHRPRFAVRPRRAGERAVPARLVVGPVDGRPLRPGHAPDVTPGVGVPAVDAGLPDHDLEVSLDELVGGREPGDASAEDGDAVGGGDVSIFGRGHVVLRGWHPERAPAPSKGPRNPGTTRASAAP